MIKWLAARVWPFLSLCALGIFLITWWVPSLFPPPVDGWIAVAAIFAWVVLVSAGQYELERIARNRGIVVEDWWNDRS